MTIEKSMIVIGNYVSEKQCALDLAAREARAKHEIALRAALVEGVSDVAELVVCETLAAEVRIGRGDGYPTAEISDEARAMVRRALSAGVLRKVDTDHISVGSAKLYHDASGFAFEGSAEPEARADAIAWSAASDYRRKNDRSAGA